MCECVYKCTFVPLCVNVCVCNMYVFVPLCVNVRMYMCVFTFICVNVCVCICV